MQTFISTKNTDPKQIIRGVTDGVLVAWRTDAAGVLWYRHMPKIHGGPTVTTGQPLDVDLDEEHDADED